MQQPELGIKVAELRKKKGYTQDKLAELCGVTPRTIQRIESGTADPRHFTIDNLSQHLEYDFSNRKPGSIKWAAAIHLSSCICLIPIPIIIWALGKEHSEIDSDARHAINFQITMSIILIGLAIMLGFYGARIGSFAKAGTFSPEKHVLYAGIITILMIICGIICFVQGIANTIRNFTNRKIIYIPAIKFLRK